MKSLNAYVRALKKVENQISIKFVLKEFETHLEINDVKFLHISKLPISDDAPSGVLVGKMSPSQENFFRLNNISFLTLHGELYLRSPNVIVDVNFHKPKKDRFAKKKDGLLSRRYPSPTTLISPNGLAILDAIFRLPKEKLEDFKSALSFTQEYRLSQPKISLMMNELKAKNILELKEKIKLLPEFWWEQSLRYSMTRKRLLPFFEGEQLYRSLLAERNDFNIRHLESCITREKGLFPGPVEVMKKLNLLRDGDIYLWGTKESLQILKKDFQLIPDQKSNLNTWHLAIYLPGPGRQNISSPLIDFGGEFLFREIKSNIFRAIWDLGFGGERLREVQMSAIRRILHGF